MIKIKPTQDRLVVEKLVETQYTTEGGIILTKGLKHIVDSNGGASTITADDGELDDTYQAIIKIVGPDVKSPELVVGTKVLLTKYAGIQITKDQDLYLIYEKEILAIVE